MAKGTKDNPWKLRTPPLSSEYEMYLDEKDGNEVIVCVVGKTTLLYDKRAIDDLHSMLKQHGDWMELGSADEQKQAKDGTVEAWMVWAQKRSAWSFRYVYAPTIRRT